MLDLLAAAASGAAATTAVVLATGPVVGGDTSLGRSARVSPGQSRRAQWRAGAVRAAAGGPAVIRSQQVAPGAWVVTEPMADVRSAAIGVWVGTGSRDEAMADAGCSHFLEHLLFKGTPRWSAAQIAEAVDEVGGDMNAFTTKEYTAFYVRLLSEHLELGLDVLCSIMTDPALRPDEVEAERQVILDEILMHADEPADVAVEQLTASLFPGHPLGSEVLGTAPSITAMEPDGIRRFFDHHYRAENLVVAAAGDVDHDVLADAVATRFAGRGGGSHPRRVAPDAPPATVAVTHRPTEQVHLAVGTRAPGRHAEERWALAILDHVLGGGLSSRLFQEVRERRGLAYSIWSDRVHYEEIGALSVGVGTAPEHAHEVLRLVNEQIDDLGEHGITDRELAVAKGHLRADTLLSLEDSGARMSRIGASMLLHGEVLAVPELLAKIEAVTLADVAEVARKIAEEPRVLSVVGPFDVGDFDA
ncbi:MAG: pitrilysin family protein [Actinomycetota bacterium]|nr:pitrilysin family protein [Actinomycetota bacterium]